MSNQTVTAWAVASRTGAGVVGGYCFCWGALSLAIALMVAAGAHYHQAEIAGNLLIFPLFVALFLWSFIGRSPVRLWLITVGGGALMALVASLLQQYLITRG